jgi:hypothetical protein
MSFGNWFVQRNETKNRKKYIRFFNVEYIRNCWVPGLLCCVRLRVHRSSNPVIPIVVHHRQNPLDSTWSVCARVSLRSQMLLTAVLQ